ncbi:MAG: cupin domain-containing protein [Gammaproteobacteria bacterium]|nr:cupin domain-containing protein [Gammaproteobacteria bacterium]
MTSKIKPITATEVPERAQKSIYPAPFAEQVQGRVKRKLGDVFGLTNFGVNLTELAPGAVSALLHHHSHQDEFIYVLSGTPTLVLDDEAFVLQPGQCYGFKAGNGVGHQLVNRSAAPVQYLEIGDRSAADYAVYPKDDLKFTEAPGGGWVLTHKDGSAY